MTEVGEKKTSSAILIVAIFVITLTAYWPSIQGGFIWDDDDYVTENETLRSVDGLIAIWTRPSATPQYYPLVHSTFWIEYQLWGLWPAGFHIVNVLVHSLTAVLLWRVLLWLRVPGAWFAALVFAIHPVHVESVAWITERKNVLSGLFYVSAVLCYLKYWDFVEPKSEQLEPPHTNATHTRWYILAHVFFIAALLSKTVTATLPAALLVLIWWKRGRITVGNVIKLTPMLVIGIAFGLMTVWLEKNQVGASGIDWELTFFERVLIAGRAIVFYASKILWPSEFIFTYPRWHIDTSELWQWIFPAAVVAVIIGGWLARNRIGHGPLAAILFFAGTLFPALGFLDVYPMRFSFVADHFQYLASIGVIALSVAVACTLLKKVSRLDWVAGLAVVAVLFTMTWRQGRIYEGLEVLWRDTLAKNPTSFMAHNNLGAMLNKRGDYAEAETHLRECLHIKPGFVDGIVNLAKAREGQQAFDEALRLYQQAVELQPANVQAYNGLGAVYGMTGETELSEKYLKKSLRLDPDYATAHSNLATLYVGMGRLDDAASEFEVALKLDDGLDEARSNLAKVLMSQQKYLKAQELFEQLLQKNPDDVSTMINLGVAAANQQDPSTAIRYFEDVVNRVPENAQAHYNLGAMYETIGDANRAEDHFRRYEQLTKK